MTDARAIKDSLVSYVEAEIECELIQDDVRGRVGCLTPLEYPDGDAVVVWVSDLGGHFEIGDLGEGQQARLGAVGDLKALKVALQRAAKVWDVRIAKSGIVADADAKALGECIWRVACASAQVAGSVESLRPRSSVVREDEFIQIVDQTLRERELPIERESKLSGKSGHDHKATIFLPATESVIEPISAEANWNRVNATYAKFGDLSQANGFHLYSLLDDRKSQPETEVQSMLLQVSDVLTWSQHDDWLRSAFGSSETS